MNSKTAAALVLLAALVTSLAGPIRAEEQEGLELDFDRESLEDDSWYRGEVGELRSGVRCATRPVAEFEQQFIASAVTERLRGRSAHREKHVEIPVYFHILRKKNGAWDVTDQQIDEQLEVLNRSFEPHGFSFLLEGVSRYNRTKFARKCYRYGAEKKFKKRYAVDPAETLNIYSCRPTQNVLGYAYYPSDFREDDDMHGLVLLYSTFPGGSAAPYDLGNTAVHEVGHYLGLLHTFASGCRKRGDRIDDTPPELSPAFGCEVGRDTCSEPGLDPIHNFMDYSDDACVDEFTSDQGARMKDQVEAFKPSLGDS